METLTITIKKIMELMNRYQITIEDLQTEFKMMLEGKSKCF